MYTHLVTNIRVTPIHYYNQDKCTHTKLQIYMKYTPNYKLQNNLLLLYPILLFLSTNLYIHCLVVVGSRKWF